LFTSEDKTLLVWRALTRHCEGHHKDTEGISEELLVDSDIFLDDSSESVRVGRVLQVAETESVHPLVHER